MESLVSHSSSWCRWVKLCLHYPLFSFIISNVVEPTVIEDDGRWISPFNDLVVLSVHNLNFVRVSLYGPEMLESGVVLDNSMAAVLVEPGELDLVIDASWSFSG
jgi:ABC-type cobalamin transport system permease subunit